MDARQVKRGSRAEGGKSQFPNGDYGSGRWEKVQTRCGQGKNLLDYLGSRKGGDRDMNNGAK